jgi:2-octaprenyl-6-methoxyphenol hydroxylase
MNKLLDYDIVIAGSGLVGASLACALSNENTRIAIIEPVTPKMAEQPSYDDRGLALSYSTIQILNGLGIWQSIKKSANPIQRVHISNQKHFGFVHLHADMMQVTALGYVVIARELGQVLLKKIKQAKNIDMFCPASVKDINVLSDHATVTISKNNKTDTVKCKLIIVADGTQSKLRDLLDIKAEVKDYQQTAIVTNITLSQPHQNTAFERFTESGPLALLPLTKQRCAVVFTVNSQNAEHYLEMEDDKFLQTLQSRFGRRLGNFQRIGARKTYPIKQVNVNEPVMDRVAVLGNAAHTLHPNGAQGFNLGLRDVAGLAEILIPTIRAEKDPGHRILLENYLELRAQDQKRIMCFTDGLASLFYNELPHKVIARNTGMLFANMIPPLKRSLMRRAMGLYGKQPALVRGVIL